jgi:hypothetical protein
MVNNPLNWLLIELSMFDVFFSDPPFSPFTSADSKLWLQNMVFNHEKKGDQFWTRVIEKFHFYDRIRLTKGIPNDKIDNQIMRFFDEKSSDWVKKFNAEFPNKKMLFVVDEASALLNQGSSLKYKLH